MQIACFTLHLTVRYALSIFLIFSGTITWMLMVHVLGKAKV